jgi:hypothetical protein
MKDDSDFYVYLAALEAAGHTQESIGDAECRSRRNAFEERGWIVPAGHLTHVPVPFLDDVIEVEVDVDERRQIYQYASLQDRSRTVVRPFSEIQRYQLVVDRWLDDLATIIGIDSRRRSSKPERIDEHVWHLGDLRVGKSHQHAPVFVSRHWHRMEASELANVMSDPIWQFPGIVLVSMPMQGMNAVPHTVRGLAEFISVGDEATFDRAAFSRVLEGSAPAIGITTIDQYLSGNQLKLPHFAKAVKLSPARAKVVKHSWGSDGHPPPVVEWKEINGLANTGYQSFDQSFKDGNLQREEVFEFLGHGKYRLRRKP